jgi:tripartite ATP-independent transporter DctP family solute receptor
MKTKKLIAKHVLVALTVFALCLALVACGGGANSGDSGSDAGSDAESAQTTDEAAADETAASTPNDDAIVLRISHVEADTSFLHKSCEEFEKFMEEKTDGKVDVQLYPNSELGDDSQALQSIQMGSLEMGVLSSSAFSQFDEKFNLVFLPFMFQSPEEAEAAIRGGFGELYNSWMEQYGLKGVAWQYDGARNIGNTKRPIKKLEDVKGLKLRCMSSDIFIEMFELMGANATPMAFSEIYTSVQNGVVDGNDNPAGLFYESKFYEVHKYYSLTGHTYGTANVVINQSLYDSFPDDIKEAFDEGAKTYLEDWQITQARNAEQDYITKINDGGCAVNVLDDGEKERFIEACSPLYGEMKEKVGDEIWADLEAALGHTLVQ